MGRRRLLAVIVLISALAATGFGVACLWELFQQLLGVTNDPSTVGWILRDAATVLVATVLATYHGRIFRRERRSPVNRAASPRITALIHPGAEEALAELTRLTGQSIDISGYLRSGTGESAMGISTLAERMSELKARGGGTGLLVLGRSGGTLYVYTKAAPPSTVLTTESKHLTSVAVAAISVESTELPTRS